MASIAIRERWRTLANAALSQPAGAPDGADGPACSSKCSQPTPRFLRLSRCFCPRRASRVLHPRAPGDAPRSYDRLAQRIVGVTVVHDIAIPCSKCFVTFASYCTVTPTLVV
jgi:hypothetical protein